MFILHQQTSKPRETSFELMSLLSKIFQASDLILSFQFCDQIWFIQSGETKAVCNANLFCTNHFKWCNHWKVKSY